MNFTQLTNLAPNSSLLYVGTYDPVLVSLSVAAAIFASYAGLLVSQQVANSDHVRTRYAWTLVGGMCLGLGIWTMHFVGMLAFTLPCSSSYEATGTLLSIVPAVLASLLAINIISRRQIARSELISGGMLIGAGIGIMHYAGMAAMHLEGTIRYNAVLFLVSLVVAVVLATGALWIKFALSKWYARWTRWANPVGAVVLGMAVSGMHYMAMAATYFIRDVNAPMVPVGMAPVFISSIVLGATGSLILVTIVAAYLGRPHWTTPGFPYKLAAALVLGWVALSWLSSGYYYDRLAAEHYAQELAITQQQANEVADNFDERLQLLKAIALMGSINDSVSKALLRSNADRSNKILTYEARKQHWTADTQLRKLNHYLDETKRSLKIDEIYVLNASGLCIAASNESSATTFVGSDFSDRQYFTQSRIGRTSLQYALGRVSRVAGLYYSASVKEGEQFMGVVVVKRDVENLRYLTRLTDTMVADANAIIILASDKNLEFLSLKEARSSKLTSEQKFIVYGQSSFDQLQMIALVPKKFSLHIS